MMGALPPTKAGLAILSIIVFLTSSATSFIGMAVESLMAYATPEDLKGRAGGSRPETSEVAASGADSVFG